MTIIYITLMLFIVAFYSGRHHASRAKRIVENNRVERMKKWKRQERELSRLQEEVNRLRRLL